MEKQKLPVSHNIATATQQACKVQSLTTMLPCKTDGWAETLGGDASPGRRWRLIFTTGQLLYDSCMADWQGAVLLYSTSLS